MKDDVEIAAYVAREEGRAEGREEGREEERRKFFAERAALWNRIRALEVALQKA